MKTALNISKAILMIIVIIFLQFLLVRAIAVLAIEFLPGWYDGTPDWRIASALYIGLPVAYNIMVSILFLRSLWRYQILRTAPAYWFPLGIYMLSHASTYSHEGRPGLR